MTTFLAFIPEGHLKITTFRYEGTNMRKNKLITLSTLGIIFTIIIRFVIACTDHENGKDLTEVEIKTIQKSTETDYLSLFLPAARQKIISDGNYVVKSKQPYATYLYDTQYRIIIHKVLNNSESLEKGIEFENKVAGVSSYSIYKGFEDVDRIKFLYSTQHDSLAGKIYVACEGKVLDKFIKGDSVLNYNVLTKGLSFKYGEDVVKDMALVLKRESDELNVNIVFIKRQSYVYIIIVYPRGNLGMDRSFIGNLFK